MRTEPQSFNPYVRHDATSYLTSLLTQARLIRLNQATQDVEPWLATDWTRSNDGLTYTVHLRQPLTFSDGVPFTADDVVFSFAAAADPSSVVADALTVDGLPVQARKLDDHTVNLVFPRPFGPGMAMFDALPILPKHLLAAPLASGGFGRAWNVASSPSEFVGLGPFVVTEYRPGERVVFSRNAHYFRSDTSGAQLPYLSRVIVEIVPDQDAQILRIEAGQSDTSASEVRPEDFASLKRAAAQGRLRLLDLGVTRDPDGLWLNLNRHAFDADKRRGWIQREELRRAISLGIDRQAFADVVFLGAAVPAFGPITPSNVKWYSDEVPRPAQDVERARALLAAIGLIDRNGDGWLDDASGDTAHLTLLTAKGQTSLERGAAEVREQLQRLGLTVDVVALEANALIQRFLSGKDYDAVYFNLTSTNTDPAMNADFWLSSGVSHVWTVNEKGPVTDWERAIDSLMARQSASLDEGERRRLFTEVQKIFAEHLPIIYFAAPRIFVAASSRLMNLTPAVSRPQLLWAADSIAIRHP